MDLLITTFLLVLSVSTSVCFGEAKEDHGGRQPQLADPFSPPVRPPSEDLFQIKILASTALNNAFPTKENSQDSIFATSPFNGGDGAAMSLYRSFIKKNGAQAGVNAVEGSSGKDIALKIIEASERSGKKHYKSLVLNGPGNTNSLMFTPGGRSLSGTSIETEEMIALLNSNGISFDRIVIASYAMAHGVDSNKNHLMRILSQQMVGHPEVIAADGPTYFSADGIETAGSAVFRVKKR